MPEEKETAPKTKRRRKKTKASSNPSTEAKKAIAAETAKQVEEDAAKKAEEEAVKAAEQAAEDKAKAEVEKKEEEKKAAPKKKPAASKVKIPEVEKLKIMLKDYLDSAPKGVATPTTRKRQVDKLVKLVTYLANNPKKEVINEAYQTFRDARNGVMHESLLFQGVNHLNASTREKVELLYGAFVLTLSNVKAKKKIRPNIDLLTKRFGDGGGSWFAAKNK